MEVVRRVRWDMMNCESRCEWEIKVPSCLLGILFVSAEKLYISVLVVHAAY
jgi:hypothetical protein